MKSKQDFLESKNKSCLCLKFSLKDLEDRGN